jgi:assimilatory nitrate reductase electron transfer subunit
LRSWGDRHVFAIGDCAHVTDLSEHEPDARPRGGPSGLIGPGWRQAAWLAASMIADASGEATPPPLEPEKASVVMLKADDIDVVAAGNVDADPWDEPGTDYSAPAVSQWADPEHGRYVKMVTRAGVLEGMVCVGMPRTGAELTLLFERGSELPADRSVLLRHDGPESTAVTEAFEADATVCWCNGVSAGSIQESVNAGCRTTDEVGAATRAGTGCGGCKGRITELIAQFAARSTATVS